VKDYQKIVAYSYTGKLHTGDVEVFIEVHRFPLVDIDAPLKATLDALEGRAYHRDSQIRSLTIDIHKCERGKDRLFVSVNPIEKGWE
jgi:Holliday junction resolvase RusA-like endonuclease